MRKKRNAVVVRAEVAPAPRVRVDDRLPDVLEEFAAGKGLRAIAAELGIDEGHMRKRLNSEEWIARYHAARLVHADGIYEEIAHLETLLRDAWGEKDSVKVMAIRAEIDTKKWRAAKMNRARYDSALDAPGFAGAAAVVRVEIVRE